MVSANCDEGRKKKSHEQWFRQTLRGAVDPPVVHDHQPCGNGGSPKMTTQIVGNDKHGGRDQYHRKGVAHSRGRGDQSNKICKPPKFLRLRWIEPRKVPMTDRGAELMETAWIEGIMGEPRDQACTKQDQDD